MKNFSIQTDVEQNMWQKRINPEFGEDETPAFTLMHIRFSYQLKKWLLQGGIENLLDKKYHAHLDWGNVPRPGRNIYLTLEIKL
jgi:iron complex outermembrane receptor protein